LKANPIRSDTETYRGPVPPPQETELALVTCQICHGPVAVEIPSESELFHDDLLKVAKVCAVHDVCYDRNEAQLQAARILKAEQDKLCSWKTLCPPEYQKPIDWSFKAAKRVNLTKLMAWTWGERGLLVTSGPGECKTRFMWKLLEREWDHGRTIAAVTHAGLRLNITALASADQAKCLSWVSDLNKVEILFVDDLGKGRATPASEEVFFNLLDSRMIACRPTLFTSDMTLDRIENVFSDDYSRGMMRRILERTEQIGF